MREADPKVAPLGGNAKPRTGKAAARRAPTYLSNGGSGSAQAARGARVRDFRARPTDARRARRLSEGRDREMVADHQGGRPQDGVIGHQAGNETGTRRPTRSLGRIFAANGETPAAALPQ